MSMFLKVDRNLAGRDFVVGDVHGHLQQLHEQLQEVAFDPARDRLFCLGDLVDRGPDSELLLAMVDQKSYFGILGNHEAMMIAGFENPETADRHRANGGEWFYRLPRAQRQHLVSQVRRWPWAIELDADGRRIGLIHANILGGSWPRTLRALTAIEEAWSAGASLEDNERVASTAEQFLWDRFLASQLYRRLLGLGDAKRTLAEYKRLFLERMSTITHAKPDALAPFRIEGIEALYLGHNFVPKPVVVGNCHFLDTYRGEEGERLALMCVSESPRTTEPLS
ncbi:metallophosphoesterase [Microbulbifer rhizosphaerae]|uniref:Putative phosphodiesterase n=1 Tax=Microbulbifer rhizosphaerae TaxID=1562603 RepID=A0A7W4W9B3_9GAMM|nr:metallophosphoesterase [Microbulbifer rhizosphaerae]MBB3060065.1 putative phosphodiesterase [Microbulbifer rhizosphaerae]